MTAYFGLSPHESIVLGILINSPNELYGLQIINASPLHRGTLYLILKRLETKGFVTSRATKRNRAGLPRRYYKATSIGKRLYQLELDTKMFLLMAQPAAT